MIYSSSKNSDIPDVSKTLHDSTLIGFEPSVEEPVLPKPETVEEPVLPKPETVEEPVLPKPETVEEPVLPKPETVEEPVLPKPETVEEPVTKINDQGLLPKGWVTKNNSNELDLISQNISEEEEKIEKQKKVSEEINLHRLKLTKLISHRKENEQKISKEKSSLESQIQDERTKIQLQTKLSQEITEQSNELLKVKKETNSCIEKN